MNKLNVGCGADIKQGFVNMDKSKLPGVDIVHDLNKYPWPFKNNEFDFINCEQILEHLADIPRSLRELWRIARKGAKIHIGAPYYSAFGSWSDLTHTHPFSWTTLDYMAANKIHRHSVGRRHSHEYGEKEKFNIIQRKFIFGRLHRIIGVSFIAHNHPMFFEMFLANIFPPRHIEFDLEVVK